MSRSAGGSSMMTYSPRLYKFVPWLIRALIPKGCRGTYVLYTRKENTIEPVYIGRSDTDLQRRLLSHPYLETADFFEYYTFDTIEKTFISEAALYHCFEGMLLNHIHPSKPANSKLQCPFCLKHYNQTIEDRINLVS